MSQSRRDASGTGDGSWSLTGTAAVFNTTTTLYEGRSWVIQERIDPAAFDGVLAGLRDGLAAGDPAAAVHLNHGHDMQTAVARLQRVGESGPVEVGGLKLWTSARGLEVFARLDSADPDVQALVPKMRRGIVDQMSFAFRIGKESLYSTEDDQGRTTDLWTIQEVSSLFDVCVCAQDAYPTTSAQLRSALRAAGHTGLDPVGLMPRHEPEGSGVEDVTPHQAGARDRVHAERLAALKARARIATMTHRRSK